MFALIAQNTQNIFGTIKPPAAIAAYDAASGSNIGLVFFVSNLIKLATVGAGLFVFFNLLSGGLEFISAGGDTHVPDKVKDKFLYSVIGLGIIVFSYVIIALISYILFKDPTYILNPTISGPF